MRFHGKAALITGAGSGIGAATATGFARRGGRVAVVDVSAEDANRVAKEITAGGGSAIAITADLSKPADIDAMLARTVEAFGRVDFLHNNAFGLPPSLHARRIARIAELDQEVWDHSIQVGLTAVVQATKRVLPIMQRQGSGAIVNTSSIAAFFGDRGSVSYNTVKAAIVNLTRVTAVEYAAAGIRANCVCPGPIDTPMLERGLASRGVTDLSPVTSAIPLGRIGRADEAAAVVLFLASELASFVTGAVFVVDGGVNASAGMQWYAPGASPPPQ